MDLIFGENPLEGGALVMALSKALDGSASQWLSQICFAGITWKQFKELFIQRFVGVETTTAILLNILHSRPKSGEGLAEYGSRIVTSLMSKWKSKDLDEIAVSVALTHMAQIDNSLLRWVYTTNIASAMSYNNNCRLMFLRSVIWKKMNIQQVQSGRSPSSK